MKRCLVGFSVSLCSFLQALPSGGQVIQGTAILSETSSTIEAHGKAIIQWDQFNVGPGESVSFTQSQPKMGVLNRVTGGSLSTILGSLEANCPIYLINGKGVYIGGDAQINTAGFIASTADISNESFWGQKELAFHHLQEGEIVNLGAVSSREGDVILIARSIKNRGEIYAPQGQVILTTTEMVIHPHEKRQVFIRPGKEGEEGIDNYGVIEAQAIYLETGSPYAHAINHNGVMKTFSIQEEKGRIFLVAHEGGIAVNGELIAPSGTIELAAENISVLKEGALDTSEDYHAGRVTLKGLESIQVEKGAKLVTNSHLQGDGGEITLWSGEKLIFEGEAQARGGSVGGSGGYIDISTWGEHYRVAGKVDTYAPNGRGGEITFDPKFVVIQSEGTDSATGNTFSYIPSETATISGQTLQEALNSGSVTIQANTDITFNDRVNVTGWWSGLTLQAGRSILFGGELTLNGGNFSATINDSGAISDRDPGVAVFSMYGLCMTQGGNVSINVGTFGGRQEGEIYLSGGRMDAGVGSISLTGYGRLEGSEGASGITISNNAQVQTSGSGTMTFQGTGGNGAQGNHGIYLADNTARVQSENGRIHLVGTGGGEGSGNMNSGIIHAGYVESTGSGNVDFEGTSIGGVNLNTGVCFVSGGVAKVSNGNLTVTGVGQGTGNQNYGVRFESLSSCESTGSGQIQLIGSTSGGNNNNHGVILSNGFVQSENGAIFIQGEGQGSGNYNYGVRLETMASVTSTHQATITIQGTNTSGLMSNIGVSVSSEGNAISSVNGDITITGSSLGTDAWNEGMRLDGGRICSTGVGASAASISIVGTGSPNGTDSCMGVDIGGYQVEVTSVDGEITIHGTASGGNAPYQVHPSEAVNTTGSGTITYREN